MAFSEEIFGQQLASILTMLAAIQAEESKAFYRHDHMPLLGVFTTPTGASWFEADMLTRHFYAGRMGLDAALAQDLIPGAREVFEWRPREGIGISMVQVRHMLLSRFVEMAASLQGGVPPPSLQGESPPPSLQEGSPPPTQPVTQVERPRPALRPREYAPGWGSNPYGWHGPPVWHGPPPVWHGPPPGWQAQPPGWQAPYVFQGPPESQAPPRTAQPRPAQHPPFRDPASLPSQHALLVKQVIQELAARGVPPAEQAAPEPGAKPESQPEPDAQETQEEQAEPMQQASPAPPAPMPARPEPQWLLRSRLLPKPRPADPCGACGAPETQDAPDPPVLHGELEPPGLL